MDLLCQLKGILHFCQCQATLLAFFSSSGSFPGQSGMYSKALTIANHRWRNHSRPSAHHLQQLALNAPQYVLPNANCLQLASYEKLALGPLRLGQPDCRTRSNVIVAGFKREILDRFQCENGQTNKRMTSSCLDVSYPYLSIPIRTYSYLFLSIQMSSAAFLWSISGLKPGNIAGSILATCQFRCLAPQVQVLWHLMVLLLGAIGSKHQRHFTLCSDIVSLAGRQKRVFGNSFT